VTVVGPEGDPGVSNMTTHRDIAVVLRSGTQPIAPESTIHGKYTGSNQKGKRLWGGGSSR
jgi:hypothetical protein